jgi:hypothetical protein
VIGKRSEETLFNFITPMPITQSETDPRFAHALFFTLKRKNLYYSCARVGDNMPIGFHHDLLVSIAPNNGGLLRHPLVSQVSTLILRIRFVYILTCKIPPESLAHFTYAAKERGANRSSHLILQGSYPGCL